MAGAEDSVAVDQSDHNEDVRIEADGNESAGIEEAGPSGGDAGEGRQQASEEDAAQNAPPHIPLSPPEDCIAVTPDRGVLKKVLEAGESDDKPSLHARCLIHYVGYLASSGEVFMNTRTDRETEDPTVVVAGRTAASQETGLCLAAASMTRGERALVYICDPAYGYGALGSFSFPAVPPNSQLVYEVEMINWEGIEETDNDRDRGSLLFEERLERAERRREAGNEQFKEGRYKEALAKYALALSYLDEDFMYQLEGHYLDKAEAVKVKVHLNMAATQLKTGDYGTAIYNCGQVLNINPNDVKALFRRGKAKHALLRTEEAQQDLEAALKISPKDREIIAELHAVRASLKTEKEASKGLYKGILGKPSPAAPAAATAAAPPSSSSPAAGADLGASATTTTTTTTGPEKRPPASRAATAAAAPPAARPPPRSDKKRGKRDGLAGIGDSLAAPLTRLLGLLLGALLWVGARMWAVVPKWQSPTVAAAAAAAARRKRAGQQRLARSR
ncbi:hypothetical protein PLESTM_000217400 [Pleodorina starrii]|nr:hypothetical protein PLESTM_000217400 [Pleodorina starrii]